jgi:site-specific recombinase XerD
MTCDTYLGRYLAHLRTKGRRSTRKIPYWLAVYDRWLADRDLTLGTVGPAIAEEFQVSLSSTYASGTVADIIACVAGFSAWLVSQGAITANPFFLMRRVKRIAKLPRSIPSQKELAAKLMSLEQFWEVPTLGERRRRYRTHVAAEVLYATGMRLAELANIEAHDINLDNNTIMIRCGKGGVPRTAWLTEYASRVLSIYLTVRNITNLTASDKLFGCQSGRTIDTAINTAFKTYVGMTCHGFRHTLGTHLLQRGCDLRHIQVILGHESLSSTTLYTKVSKDDLRTQLDLYHPRSQL